MLLALLAAAIVLDPGGGGAFRVTGWNASAASSSDFAQILAVYVEPRAKDALPLLGRYEVQSGELLFHPRFPLMPGISYRVVFHAPGEAAIERVFAIPLLPKHLPTEVVAIYPSASTLPENTLKFYIYFSAPMSRGDAYNHIHLYETEKGPVEVPFLEISEELWDNTARRFTLLFSPGRIKRGLVPNKEMGPPLVAGKNYTLTIDTAWLDGSGQPLATQYEKAFTAGPAERRAVDLSTWKILTPDMSPRQPLEVNFPRPMDRALLDRMIAVIDPAGHEVSGDIEVDRNEMRWRFTPREPWGTGDYRLRVDEALEDLAGNKVDLPFDVDVFERVTPTIRTETKTLTFKVRKPATPAAPKP